MRASKSVYHPQGDSDNFKSVEEALDTLDDRVTTNEADIASNDTDIATINTTLATLATKAQSWEQSFFFEYPENKSYRMVVNSEIGRTITRMTTICTTGTATVKGLIDGVDLGGTANSVSTSEQSQTHSSANVVHVGDNIAIVFSSVSSCENVTVTIAGTLTLA